MDQPSSTESNAITLRIRFKSASLDEFIGRYGADVSPGGIFIRTRQPVEVGTSLQFDFSLADGSSLLSGTGTVAWVRESDPGRANSVPGMGLRFDKLTPESQHHHQVILAEKARKEGKASSTPYPPTSFVAPASRVSPPPDLAKPVESAAHVPPGPVNFATTRPAPAVAIQPPAPAAPAVPVASSPFTLPTRSPSPDVDEFSEGGKTEISDKPVDYYMKQLDAAKAQEEGKHPEVKTSEANIPRSLFDDLGDGGASGQPITKSGPPPEGFDIPDSDLVTGEKPAAAQPAAPQRKSGSREAFAALLDLDAKGKQEQGQSDAPSEEVLEELSGGAPIEETAPEKTEEVLTSPATASLAAPEPIDLGTGREAGFDERPEGSRDGIPSLRRKSSTKTVVLVAVVAAAAAFGAVYLAKTKPWQEQAKPEAPIAVAPPVAPPPPAARPVPPPPPAAEPAKPAAEKPKVEEPKVAVAEKAAAKEPEKPAEKAEKKEPAEEQATLERSGAGKAGASKPGKAGAKTAPSALEQVHRLMVKSKPIAAEVLIDGEYFSRTPCERRILEPSKPLTVTVRKEGYDPYERLVAPSDNWVKKGEDYVFTVSATLKRAKHPAAGIMPPPVVPEVKTEKWPDTGPEKPKAQAPAEPAKPAAAKEPVAPAAKEPAKTEPTALPKPEFLKAEAEKPEPKPEPKAAQPKPEAPKPEPAKAEPAKPAAPAPAVPAAKPMYKPAPDFDDQGKAKE